MISNKQKLKPLSVIPAGERVRIVRINAGQGLNSRMASMGLLPNVQITVVNNHHPGPFVVDLQGSKLILGRGMANKVLVSEI